MAKIRTDPRTGMLEIDLSVEELISVLQAMGYNSHFASSMTAKLDTQRVTTLINEAKQKHFYPAFEELTAYILSRTNYEHDINETEQHFFGRRTTAREDPNLYRKLTYDLEKARKMIEKEKQGAFEQRKTKSRNLKRYTFRPITANILQR